MKQLFMNGGRIKQQNREFEIHFGLGKETRPQKENINIKSCTRK